MPAAWEARGPQARSPRSRPENDSLKIDLHLHTSASDGRCGPQELVERAAAAGLTVLSVADHDTVASVSAVTTLAARAGIIVVPGIEITSVWRGIDVHVLGYFFDPDSEVLAAFLERQRASRIDRLHVMAARLADLGSPIDIAAIAESPEACDPRSVGRPHLARALVDAGHASDVGDAFERFLRAGSPAFVPRRAPSPFDVIRTIERAGGCSSLAHPSSIGHDELIPDLVDAGLDAIEAYHPDHGPAVVEHYRRLAGRHGLAVTGGSDYHADPAHGTPELGGIVLPAEDYEALRQRHLRRRSADRRCQV